MRGWCNIRHMKRKSTDMFKKFTISALLLFPISSFAYELLDSSFTKSDVLSVYVNAAIKWFIGLSTGLAVVMLVYSGFMIATKMGDPGRISKAKEHIKDAVFGLIIIAISWLLLQQIYTDFNVISFS